MLPLQGSETRESPHKSTHRGLFATNITELVCLLQAKQPPHILLTDFDIAQEKNTQTLATSVPKGTLSYMSPEAVEGKPPGMADDIWCAPT